MIGDGFKPVSTATVSWADDAGLHIHVFICDGHGVVERIMEPGIGWCGGTLQPFTPANHVSAMSWVDGNGGHVRLYCTTDGTVTEWCLDGARSAWFRGGY